MKIVFLTTDGREFSRDYEKKTPWFGTAPQALIEGFKSYKSDIEMHVVCCTQKRMQSPVKIADNIWFHSLYIPKWGWLRSGYIGCAWGVHQKLAQISPDLVHAQGTERDCAFSAVFSGYPKLLTIHGNLRIINKQLMFKPFSAMWLQTLLEGFLVPKFDGVICITNYTREAVKHEVPKTWVVPNAVDTTFLALGKQKYSDLRLQKSIHENRETCPIILVVANIDHRKNQNALIRALDPLVNMKKFEVRFFGVSGDNDYVREFRELISSRPWCHYGGMIGRLELKAEFQMASMLVLPSHEDNCPMVVLEAQAAGVPVIASDVGGVPELIENEISGIMINPCIAESISSAVNRLLEDPSLCERLARCAYDRAIKRFHPLVIAKRHLEIYREVLFDHKTRPKKEKDQLV